MTVAFIMVRGTRGESVCPCLLALAHYPHDHTGVKGVDRPLPLLCCKLWVTGPNRLLIILVPTTTIIILTI